MRAISWVFPLFSFLFNLISVALGQNVAGAGLGSLLALPNRKAVWGRVQADLIRIDFG
jgi:membrane associated rhomboid family serine protease